MKKWRALIIWGFINAALLALLWPPMTPYVTIKARPRHEVIWVWRAPAYAMSVAWYVRWNWRAPLVARAYCFDPSKVDPSLL